MEYNMSESNQIVFIGDHDEEIVFTVIEQTKVNGCQYLLVTEANVDEEESDAYILKDVSEEAATDAIYEMVEDENEIDAVGRVFSELLDDFEIE